MSGADDRGATTPAAPPVEGGSVAEELTDADVMAAADVLAEKLAEKFAALPALNESELRRAVLEALREDEPGLNLMAAAFYSGREEAAREAMIVGGVPDALDPTWSEIEGEGLRKAMHRESHACLRCAHEAVCAVATTINPRMLVAVSRCLAFSGRAG